MIYLEMLNVWNCELCQKYNGNLVTQWQFGVHHNAYCATGPSIFNRITKLPTDLPNVLKELLKFADWNKVNRLIS